MHAGGPLPEDGGPGLGTPASRPSSSRSTRCAASSPTPDAKRRPSIAGGRRFSLSEKSAAAAFSASTRFPLRLRRGRGNAQGNLATQGYRIHRTCRWIRNTARRATALRTSRKVFQHLEAPPFHCGRAALLVSERRHHTRRVRCRRPPFHLSSPVHSGTRSLSPSPIRPDTLRPPRTPPVGVGKADLRAHEKQAAGLAAVEVDRLHRAQPAMRSASHWTGTPPLRLMRPSTNTAT